MKYLLAFILLINSSSMMIAQDNLFTSEYFTYTMPLPEKYWSEAISRDDFPKMINTIIDTNLNRWLGNGVQNISFVHGVIVNLDNYYQENPAAIFRQHSYIPAYGLTFGYSDTTIGIKRYDLVLGFDKYGHLLNMNFPRLIGLQCDNFTPLDKAKAIADSLIALEMPEYKEHYTKLLFDDCINDIYWEFMYSDGKDEKGSRTYYYAISLNSGNIIHNKTNVMISLTGNMLGALEEIDLEEEEIVPRK